MLADAARLVDSDLLARAEQVLAQAHEREGSCARLSLAHLATSGWNAARAAAARGGSAESLIAATRVLKDLSASSTPDALRYEREYSRSLIAAAMAAAQDERDEIRVHLEQARWVRDLFGGAASGLWPLPLDEAEGELWLEVDRYGDAVVAFRRAVAVGRHRALAGLARSAAALGDGVTACESYRQWLAKTIGLPETRRAAERYVTEHCRSTAQLESTAAGNAFVDR